MNQETINAIKEALVPVAQKIGETAEWGWGVVIRQMYVEAILGIFYTILGIVVLVATYKLVRFVMKQCKEDRYSDWGLVGIIGGIIGTSVGFLLFFGGGYDAITRFVNPEFYAIKFFLELVK